MVAIADPEVTFLWGLEGTPPGPRPTTLTHLMRLRGLLPPDKRQRPGWAMSMAETAALCERWLAATPRGKAWWAAGGPRVPLHWPGAIAEFLPDTVTPWAWAREVLPVNEQQPTGLRRAMPPGTPELAAAAVGVELTPQELRRAEQAARELLTDPSVLVWAYDLDLDGLPLPMDGKGDLKAKLEARRRLQNGPLLCGKALQALALPQSVRDEPWTLLVACPRRSHEVSRTGKLAWRRVAAPKNAAYLRSRGIDVLDVVPALASEGK